MCFAFPDVCKTPTPVGPVPLPYPNIAQCSDGSGSSKVKTGGSEILRKGDSIRMSSGDEAGSATGVVSNKIKGAAEVARGMDRVKAEGKAVGYLTVNIGQNGGSMENDPKMGVNVAPGKVHVKVLSVRGKEQDVRCKVDKFQTDPDSGDAIAEEFAPTSGMNQAGQTAARARLASNARAASEQVGDLGAQNAATQIAERFGGLTEMAAFAGRSVVDVIAICGNGVILVLEAKGGASALGSAMVSNGFRYQQGTAAYLAEIAKRMAKRPGKIGEMGRKLQSALKNGDPPVRYAEARTDYDKNGAGNTVVREFDP